MTKRARGHWLLWGDSDDRNDFLRTVVWDDLTAGLARAVERTADVNDDEQSLDPAREYPYYPTNDPREQARDAAQLAMIRAQDPGWTPPGSDSPGWMLVVHDVTEDQVRAKAAALGSNVRGFIRVG
jgi:hypothetical protein